MQRFRAYLFAAWLVASVAILGIAFLPLLLLPQGALMAARMWARTALFGLRLICGVRWELRGRENLPEGSVIVAAKHQSQFDTIVPFLFLSDPCFALKAELMKLPIYGWYAARAHMIPVHRGGKSKAVKSLLRHAKARLAKPAQFIIYPEGTRRPVGAPPQYKVGVAAMYGELGIPCVPLATNSGLFWQGKGYSLKSGTAVFEMLPPIPPGLEREAFMAELQKRIETASDRLVSEGFGP